MQPQVKGGDCSPRRLIAQASIFTAPQAQFPYLSLQFLILQVRVWQPAAGHLPEYPFPAGLPPTRRDWPLQLLDLPLQVAGQGGGVGVHGYQLLPELPSHPLRRRPPGLELIQGCLPLQVLHSGHLLEEGLALGYLGDVPLLLVELLEGGAESVDAVTELHHLGLVVSLHPAYLLLPVQPILLAHLVLTSLQDLLHSPLQDESGQGIVPLLPLSLPSPGLLLLPLIGLFVFCLQLPLVFVQAVQLLQAELTFLCLMRLLVCVRTLWMRGQGFFLARFFVYDPQRVPVGAGPEVPNFLLHQVQAAGHLVHSEAGEARSGQPVHGRVLLLVEHVDGVVLVGQLLLQVYVVDIRVPVAVGLPLGAQLLGETLPSHDQIIDAQFLSPFEYFLLRGLLIQVEFLDQEAAFVEFLLLLLVPPAHRQFKYYQSSNRYRYKGMSQRDMREALDILEALTWPID